jgi:molybdate transport system substrate-binding protein
VESVTETAVTILSSMATKSLLAELAGSCGEAATVESVGGVDALRRVRGGEAVDIVVLAAKAMRGLAEEGFVEAGSLVDLAVSSMVVAVREGTPHPDLSTPEAMKAAVLDAPRTGYSTGPSGEHMLRLIDAWGIRQALGERLVQAPPGVPVGRLLAEGRVDLAVQQMSELMNLNGVAIVGPLPAAVQSNTVFTAGIARSARQAEAARRVIAFMASPGTAAAKRANGMQPV